MRSNTIQNTFFIPAVIIMAVIVFIAEFSLPVPAETRDEGDQTGALAGDSSEPCTIRMVIWDYDVTLYDRELVEAFEQTHPGIHVEVVSYSTLYYNDSLDSLLDSGENIDIIVVNQMSQLYQVVSRGIALPLEDRIREEGIDLSHYPDLDGLRDEEGQLLALPYRKDKFLLYYNRELFDMAGIPMEEAITWEDFSDKARKLQSSLGKGRYGIYVLQLAERLSNNYSDLPVSWRTLPSEEILRQLEFYLELEKEGLCMPYAWGKNVAASQQLFETGDYGMFVQGTWYLNVLKNDTDRGRLDFSWGAVRKPAHDFETVEAAGGETTMMTPVCIHRNSKEKEAAWEFLRFMTGSEGAAVLADALIVPAYIDEDIYARLAGRLEDYGIEPKVVLEGYGEPEIPLSARENEKKGSFYTVFGRCLSGVLSPQEAVEEMEKIRENG